MTPKMTQHGAQLGPFGGSFGSKKSVKNETQKQAPKREREKCGKQLVGPLKETKNKNFRHQTTRRMDRTRPGVPGGTVADLFYSSYFEINENWPGTHWLDPQTQNQNTCNVFQNIFFGLAR